MHVYVCLHRHACVCVQLYVTASACVCVCVNACVCLLARACMCVRATVCNCKCLCLFMQYAYLYICVCMFCVYLYNGVGTIITLHESTAVAINYCWTVLLKKCGPHNRLWLLKSYLMHNRCCNGSLLGTSFTMLL